MVGEWSLLQHRTQALDRLLFCQCGFKHARYPTTYTLSLLLASQSHGEKPAVISTCAQIALQRAYSPQLVSHALWILGCRLAAVKPLHSKTSMFSTLNLRRKGPSSFTVSPTASWYDPPGSTFRTRSASFASLHIFAPSLPITELISSLKRLASWTFFLR